MTSYLYPSKYRPSTWTFGEESLETSFGPFSRYRDIWSTSAEAWRHRLFELRTTISTSVIRMHETRQHQCIRDLQCVFLKIWSAIFSCIRVAVEVILALFTLQALLISVRCHVWSGEDCDVANRPSPPQQTQAAWSQRTGRARDDGHWITYGGTVKFPECQLRCVWERPTHGGKKVQSRLRKAHGQLRKLVLHKGTYTLLSGLDRQSVCLESVLI